MLFLHRVDFIHFFGGRKLRWVEKDFNLGGNLGCGLYKSQYQKDDLNIFYIPYTLNCIQQSPKLGNGNCNETLIWLKDCYVMSSS